MGGDMVVEEVESSTINSYDSNFIFTLKIYWISIIISLEIINLKLNYLKGLTKILNL